MCQHHPKLADEQGHGAVALARQCSSSRGQCSRVTGAMCEQGQQGTCVPPADPRLWRIHQLVPGWQVGSCCSADSAQPDYHGGALLHLAELLMLRDILQPGAQVAIGVKVFADWHKVGGESPRMVAYLAQRGHPLRGPIPFGPTSPCGRPGLAQYQLFLPLQQVLHRTGLPVRSQLTHGQRCCPSCAWYKFSPGHLHCP